MREHYAPPFDESRIRSAKVSKGGAESKISKLGNDHILKEPQNISFIEALAVDHPPVSAEEQHAIDELAAYFKSRERLINTKHDFDELRKIFGQSLAETSFVVGEPREGNESGTYIFQEKVHGKTWTEFSQEKTEDEKRAFRERNRVDLIRLIGGARKVLIAFGSPVDLWSDNVMVRDEDEKLILVDPGTPSELSRHLDTILLKLPHSMRGTISEKIRHTVHNLDRYLQKLNLTPTERTNMNSIFQVNEQEYEEAKQALYAKLQTLVA